jgi:hypothetical protein
MLILLAFVAVVAFDIVPLKLEHDKVDVDGTYDKGFVALSIDKVRFPVVETKVGKNVDAVSSVVTVIVVAGLLVGVIIILSIPFVTFKVLLI